MSANYVKPPAYSPPLEWRTTTHVTRQDMAFRADSAVSACFDHARRVMGNNDPSEPNLVLSFFLHGLERLEKDWNDALKQHGVSLTLSGVFSHQTPKVKPEITDPHERNEAEKALGPMSNKTCELGDLLFVVIHDGCEEGSGMAWLLQAKKEFDAGADPLQRTLYEYADRFEYNRSTPALNGQSRELPAKDSTALSYWEIEDRFGRRRYFWPLHRAITHAIHAPDARIDHCPRESFGDTLTQLVFGEAGEAFQLGKPCIHKSAWSNIVYDLLSVTAEKLTTCRIGNVRKVARGRIADHAVRRLIRNNGVVVRNSLGEALRKLANGFKEAADKLDSCESLETDGLEEKADGPVPPIERLELPDDGSGGPTLILVHCHRK